MEQFVKMQTENISAIFKIKDASIDKGQPANLTLFNPGEDYLFEETGHIFKIKE